MKWDKKFFIGSILVPVALAVIGWVYVNPPALVTKTINNHGIFTEGQTGNNTFIQNNYGAPANEWQPLQPDQLTALKKELEKISPPTRQTLIMRCNSDSSGCKELAASFGSAFKKVGWPGSIIDGGYLRNFGVIQDHGVVGIKIYGAGNLKELKNAIEVTTPYTVEIGQQSLSGSTILYIGYKS